ncbi:uncharacterized protein LOC110737736 isoform X1 [Chenopodium quinoa]|uniref:uncharacterized protein LOC110737736 isoform X1 n=1 Tax=Chenopodium quinoa TaxID=63459 RepID=UPI000B781734|nr:uncharacterized protein LOC110737736 isoform X1 [Chenopodium quinoa]XP_021773765.1 uncharacterized protein LOC110737736 isoform X1 [Chenopodium quinoa]
MKLEDDNLHMEDDNLHTSNLDDVLDDKKEVEIKHRMPHKLNTGGRRSFKRVALLLTVPTYTLKVGSMNVCHENRIRLRYLLRKLVVQRNWVDASGVLSALLQGTCREKAPQSNRFKYWVAMELLQHMDCNLDLYSSRIEHLYDTWKEKIKSNKRRPLKDRSVLLEYILFCLARNNHDSARLSLHSLQQEYESARDLKSNLVMGLTNYELWYSQLPNKMRLGNLEESCMPMESVTTKTNSQETDNLKDEDAASIYETFSELHYHSETSIVNGKDTCANVSQKPDGGVSGVKQVENDKKQQSQNFYMRSDESSVETDGSNQHAYDQYRCSSVYNVHSLQSLLPIRVPSSDNLMDMLSSRRQFFGDHYKEALKFLKLALQSPPPISVAALLPLIQLLLLDGHGKEALTILEQSCNESSYVLSFRLKARLCECFDVNNYDELSACFEDVMKRDPTCRHSLARLLDLNKKGEYVPERLVEMIALHLEATYGDHTSWREFALCLLKLSQCEEDRMSMCVVGEQIQSQNLHTIRFSRTPPSFVEGTSGKTWKFRCKWWLNRHFSKHVLASEIAEGDSRLMLYKAACASHFYGKEMEYVVRVHTYLNEHENDRNLSSILYTHMQNSVGFFSNLVRK